MKSTKRITAFVLIILGISFLVFSVVIYYWPEQPKEDNAIVQADVLAFCDPIGSRYGPIQIEPSQFYIAIPKLGVKDLIYEGVDRATLNKGVGHYPGTAWPEEGGNMVLAGHSARTTEHTDPFGRIDELDEGDVILIVDNFGIEYRYIVKSQTVVASTDMSAIEPTQESTITLISCLKPDYPRDKRVITTGIEE